MMKWALCILSVWWVAFPVRGDHLKISTVERISSGKLSFQLTWDNSWCNAYNYDAVYLFCKYRTSASVGWQPLRFGSDPGSHAVAAGYELEPVNGGLGIIVYRASKDQGHAAVNLQLSIDASMEVDMENAEFSLHGVEMVYVPTAPFYTRDSLLYTGTDENNTLPYPNGVRNFYTMKYELSQEQYVVFLNHLNRSAQYPRTIGGLLDGLEEGDYIFGDNRTAPSHRNGIVVHRRPSGSGDPYIFACNLETADVPGSLDDGQGVACNYLSPSDLLAYADWCGLRPLTEDEYEKMCGGNGISLPSGKEYAWGEEGAVYATSLDDRNRETERASNPLANVNAGGKLEGPSRVGMFTRPGMRVQTGTALSGISDLSGNVYELYYSRSAQAFNGSIHGSGVLYNNGMCSVSPTVWPSTLPSFRLRGGSFGSLAEDLLLKNVREATDKLETMDSRHAEVGFRLGLSSEVTEEVARLTLQNGQQSGTSVIYDTVCDRSAYTIRGDRTMRGSFYLWYESRDGGTTWQRLQNESSPDLCLRRLTDSVGDVETKTFLYRRQDYTPNTIRRSGVVGIVVGYGYRFNRLTDTLQPCMPGNIIQVTTVLPSHFRWYNATDKRELEGESLLNGSTYEPCTRDFLTEGEFQSKVYEVEVEIEMARRCRIKENVQVFVKPYTCDPFSASVEKIVYANADSSTLTRKWSGKDPLEWSLLKTTVETSRLNEQTGVLYGLSNSLCYEIEVELKCKDYPDKTYRKRVEEYERIYSYTGDYQMLNLLPGNYMMECWGADGGRGSGGSNPPGIGGYTRGNISFPTLQTIYVYTGEYGNGTRTATAFNGGGHSFSGSGHNGGRGGGASDIRLLPGSWNDPAGLKSRIMVAAGGGGAMSDCGGSGATAGHGGGLSGYSSVNQNGTYVNNSSYGGTQTAGGTYRVGSNGTNNGVRGSLGQGGYANTCAAGGGGGYYGGGAQYTSGGGGGSSFISGYEGCDALNEQGIHTGQPLHYSGFSFTNTLMLGGDENPAGKNTNGYGKIKITVIR